MTPRDLFLAQHSAVHSAAVGGNKASGAERTFGGLTDEQMRVRPREDLNSVAWLMWHIARAEDIMVNAVLSGGVQVLDDAWLRRLAVTRRDFGIGMTKDEVTALTKAIDIAALREYRDAVGKRTREVVGNWKDGDWDGDVQKDAMERAGTQGAFGEKTAQLTGAFAGRPRAMVLSGICLMHPAVHMGEAMTVRTAGGFGSGI